MVLVNRIQCIFVCIGFLFTFFPKYSHTQTTETDSTLGWIELQCKFPNLDVYLDNTHIGKTPLQKHPLSLGEHTIQVKSPEPLNWLSRDWIDTVCINTGEILILTAQFNHTCWIGSTPSGAHIYSGEHLIGKTPTAVTISDTAIRCLTLKHPGYHPQTVDWTVQASRIIHIVLEKSNTCGKVKPENNLSLDSKKYWMIGSSILAIASGIAGYHYKERAEKAYQAYLQSGNPEQMNRYFDDSKRYDICSGILYGIGEVCVGITIYLGIRGTSKN
jgi:hypothetical protein